MSYEAEVTGYTESLKDQWEVLLDKIEEKTQKLREANQQQQFNEAVNDMDFWLGEVCMVMAANHSSLEELGEWGVVLYYNLLLKLPFTAKHVQSNTLQPPFSNL